MEEDQLQPRCSEGPPISPQPEDREALRALIREELERLLVRAARTPYRELPIEPVFTVEVACAAVPCSRRALYVWLARGGFEAAYRWAGNRRYRMIPGSQVRWIRE